MTEQRTYAEAKVFGCNNVRAELHNADNYRWLTIISDCNGNQAQMTLFFKSLEDQETVIHQLYTELCKLQP